MAKITGAKQHEAHLRRLTGAKVAAAVTRGLYVAGQEIEIEAEISITSGSISGKGHVPSAPGQPPNADTRLLDTSIHTTVESQSPPKVFVTSNAPYAADLEFGTSKMEERPYMRPATTKMRHRAAEIIARVFKMATK